MNRTLKFLTFFQNTVNVNVLVTLGIPTIANGVLFTPINSATGNSFPKPWIKEEGIEITGTEEVGQTLTFKCTWFPRGDAAGTPELTIYRQDFLNELAGVLNPEIIDTFTNGETTITNGVAVTEFTYTLVAADLAKFIYATFTAKTPTQDSVPLSSNLTGAIASDVFLPNSISSYETGFINSDLVSISDSNWNTVEGATLQNHKSSAPVITPPSIASGTRPTKSGNELIADGSGDVLSIPRTSGAQSQCEFWGHFAMNETGFANIIDLGGVFSLRRLSGGQIYVNSSGINTGFTISDTDLHIWRLRLDGANSFLEVDNVQYPFDASGGQTGGIFELIRSNGRVRHTEAHFFNALVTGADETNMKTYFGL